MKALIIVILILLAIPIIAMFVGPLILLTMGLVLAYQAYKNLKNRDSSSSSVILWAILGIAGITMAINALPGLFIFGGVVLIIYFVSKRNNSKTGSNSDLKPGHLEAEWREI